MFLSLLQLLIIIIILEEKPIFNVSHKTIGMLTTSCKVTPDTVYGGEIVLFLQHGLFPSPMQLRNSCGHGTHYDAVLIFFHDNGALARHAHLRSQSLTTLAVPYVHRFVSTFPQSGRFCKVILRRS